MLKKIKVDVTIEYIKDDNWKITCSAPDHTGSVISGIAEGWQLGYDFEKAYHAMTAKIAASNQEVK